MSNPSWEKCEIEKKEQDKNRGCGIIPTGIGSDYLRICPGEKPTLVEVKDGCGSLTRTQRATKKLAEKIGLNYSVERCHCETE